MQKIKEKIKEKIMPALIYSDLLNGITADYLCKKEPQTALNLL